MFTDLLLIVKSYNFLLINVCESKVIIYICYDFGHNQSFLFQNTRLS